MIDYPNLFINSVALPILSALVWQTLRSAWLLHSLQEPFLSGFFVRPKVSNKRDRNVVHARLGTIHCLSVLLVSSLSLYNHWDQSWEQWNFQRPSGIDKKHFVQPMWVLYISIGYFISDFFYISDFPAYTWHHVLAIANLAIVASDPLCSMVASNGLFVAETGGLLLTAYLQFKSLTTHFIFILCYGFSRFVLIPIFIYQMWKSLLLDDSSVPTTVNIYVAWFVSVASLGLVFVNWNFWWTHTKKFLKKLNERKLEKEKGAQTGKRTTGKSNEGKKKKD